MTPSGPTVRNQLPHGMAAVDLVGIPFITEINTGYLARTGGNQRQCHRHEVTKPKSDSSDRTA